MDFCFIKIIKKFSKTVIKNFFLELFKKKQITKQHLIFFTYNANNFKIFFHIFNNYFENSTKEKLKNPQICSKKSPVFKTNLQKIIFVIKSLANMIFELKIYFLSYKTKGVLKNKFQMHP